MKDENPVEEAPLLAGAVMLVVAAVAWVAVSLAMGGDVRPLNVALFAVAFTAVYLAFSLYYPG